MKTLTPSGGRAVAPLTFPKGLGKRESWAAVNPLSSCRRQPRSSPWLLFGHCCVAPGEQGGPRLVISLPMSTFKKKNRHLLGSSWPWEAFKQKQGKSCLVSLKISVQHEAAVSPLLELLPPSEHPSAPRRCVWGPILPWQRATALVLQPGSNNISHLLFPLFQNTQLLCPFRPWTCIPPPTTTVPSPSFSFRAGPLFSQTQ